MAAVEGRGLGWTGEMAGLAPGGAKRLADLMDAVHNIPEMAANWERCDEQLLRATLGRYDERHGGGLLATYDRVVAENWRSG